MRRSVSSPRALGVEGLRGRVNSLAVAWAHSLLLSYFRRFTLVCIRYTIVTQNYVLLKLSVDNADGIFVLLGSWPLVD